MRFMVLLKFRIPNLVFQHLFSGLDLQIADNYEIIAYLLFSILPSFSESVILKVAFVREQRGIL